MLRVGLTGGLGSGKSTVAMIFRQLGAEVIEADELGRALMEPGQAVFEDIVSVFGPAVVDAQGRLDRAKLADIAFRGGRLAELNAIVHPAVIEAQKVWMEKIGFSHASAIAIVESALIFEVERDARERGEAEGVLADWRRRFDRVVLMTAPDELKVRRYVDRLSPSGWDERIAADARSRLARQMRDEEKIARADFVIENTGDLAGLRHNVEVVWSELRLSASKSATLGGEESY